MPCGGGRRVAADRGAGSCAANVPRRPAAVLVGETLHAGLQEAPGPFDEGRPGHVELGLHRSRGGAIGEEQHDLPAAVDAGLELAVRRDPDDEGVVRARSRRWPGLVSDRRGGHRPDAVGAGGMRGGGKAFGRRSARRSPGLAAGGAGDAVGEAWGGCFAGAIGMPRVGAREAGNRLLWELPGRRANAKRGETVSWNTYCACTNRNVSRGAIHGVIGGLGLRGSVASGGGAAWGGDGLGVCAVGRFSTRSATICSGQ